MTRIPSNTRLGSTKCPGIHATLRGVASPPEGESAAEQLSFRFGLRNPNKPLWLKVQYAGGSEGHWIIECRGERIRRGSLSCLGELMNFLNGR